MRAASTGRKHSDETKQKLRILSTGKKHSDESKQKMRILSTGKKHSDESKRKMSEARTKRGCISFDKTKNRWSFRWIGDGKLKSKTFSVNKYGDKTTAYRKAVKYQDKIYPIESESDSD